VFHMDVVKVDRDVAYVVMVVHLCCKCLYLDVAYVSYICCKCFIWMLHVFVIFFKCLLGISNACFEVFHLSFLYVTSVA
jgi:hypothetical protein